MFRNYFIIFLCILMCPRRSYPITARQNGEDETPFKDNVDNEKEQEDDNLATLENSEEIEDIPRFDAEPGYNLSQAEIEKYNLWTYGLIPYYIDKPSFDFGFRDMIRTFLSQAHSLTGLYFLELATIPKVDDVRNYRYVFFVNRRGVLDCPDYSALKLTRKGPQRVVVGYNCFSTGRGPGSMILALAGIPPMHRAPYRDNFITVRKYNGFKDKAYLFDQIDAKDWPFQGVDYDWYSAGHYIWHKYTINGKSTITPKREAPLRVGEFKQLSRNDVWKIKILYTNLWKPNKLDTKTQCNKLFKPGPRFQEYVPRSEEVLTPREKPGAFLSDDGGHDETIPEHLVGQKDHGDDANHSGEDGIANPALGTKPEKINKLKREPIVEDPFAAVLSESDFNTSERERLKEKRVNDLN